MKTIRETGTVGWKGRTAWALIPLGIGLGIGLGVGSSGCLRPIGTVRPGDTRDACCSWDAQVDADMDAGPQPDTGCAGLLCGSGVCILGEQAFMEGEAEPRFVYDGELLSGGRGLLTGAVGWGNPSSLVVWLVALPELDIRDRLELSGDWLSVGVGADDAVALLRHQENWNTDLSWVRVSGGTLEMSERQDLCEACFPTRSGPLVSGDRAAFAVEHRDDSGMDVGIAFRQGGMTMVTSDNGEQPVLADLGDRVIVAYLRDGMLVTQMFDWEGNLLIGPTAADVGGRLSGDIFVTVRGATPVLWAFRPGDSLGSIVEVSLQPSGMVGQVQEYGGVAQFPMGLRACANDTDSFLVWGEMAGPCGVGVHGLWLTRLGPDGDESIFSGPGLISEPVQYPTSSYSIWPVCLQNRAGYFVFWGAWQQETNYGLYGRSINLPL